MERSSALLTVSGAVVLEFAVADPVLLRPEPTRFTTTVENLPLATTKWRQTTSPLTLSLQGKADSRIAKKISFFKTQEKYLFIKRELNGILKTSMEEKIFKAYDIRGVYSSEIDEDAVERIVKAYVTWLKPKRIALGRDVRLSSEDLFQAASGAALELGVEVIDIGIITTDMLYFAVSHYGYDGGITITASHNPAEYNGMKLIRDKSKPVSGDTGLEEIKKLAIANNKFVKVGDNGSLVEKEITDDYLDKIFSFIDIKKIKKQKIVVNPNFGAAGRIVEKMSNRLNLELIKLNFEPDGNFPKGRPDPLIEDNRVETSELVKKHKADFAVAWDADADRCFFFDENGEFIDGYYEAAILSQIILDKYPGGKVIHDPRLIWATHDLIIESGGKPLINKVGHSFIKERMRREDAIFAGENSGHFYFKDYYYCDNGMIPFLLMLNKISETGRKMSELVESLRKKYPNSGEINFTVTDAPRKIKEIEEIYHEGKIEKIDGLSIEYPDWRFNLRSSNTEPLLRLNLEAKSQKLVDEKVAELKKLIEN